MAKASIVLFKSKKYKDGNSPIMLCVTKNSALKYFKIGDERFNILPKQWNKEFGLVQADKRLNPEHDFINGYIKEKHNQAVKIIEKYEEKGIAWTFNMFDQEYRNKPKITKVKPFILTRIEELKTQNKFKSARVLSSTLHLIEKYNTDFHKLYFQDIDYEFVEGFYFYLKNTRKNKDTSIGIALREIRSILNDAIGRGAGSKETYPFSKIYGATRVFKISKLEKRTKKRFVPKEYLIKLTNSEILEPHLIWAKQMFLFSFFASGINFKDMAFLTDKNIKTRITEDGREVKFIEFLRKKTNENIAIPITKNMLPIIEWAKANTTNNNKYLLPIITKTKLTGEQLNNHIDRRRKRLNMHLRTIATKLEFPESLLKLSSYYARHSYATTMLRNGAQIEKISEALGHASTKTTQIYLESFGIEEIAKLNENLL
jgi:site-specific recombinase XerD